MIRLQNIKKHKINVSPTNNAPASLWDLYIYMYKVVHRASDFWDINFYRLFLALAMLLALLKNFLYSPFLPLTMLLATAKQFCTGHIEMEKLLT